MVTVQEICTDQWDELKYRLGGASYQTDFIITKDNDDAAFRTCEWFGNAVFWLGGDHADANYRDWFNYQSVADTNSRETRGVICGKAAFPVFQACSGHITNDNETSSDGDSVKKNQLNELMDWVVFSDACCAQTFLGADLNLNVNGVKASDSRPYSTAWQESDELGTTNDRNTMTGSGTKIDYVFVPEDTHYIAHDAYIFPPAVSTHSDHRIVVGYQRSR